MPGIPATTYRQLCHALEKCDLFYRHENLMSIFVDSRIIAWRGSIPEADTKKLRVERVIAYLYEQSNNLGENALILLLRALIDREGKGNSYCQELTVLIDELENVLGETSEQQAHVIPQQPIQQGDIESERLPSSIFSQGTISVTQRLEKLISQIIDSHGSELIGKISAYFPPKSRPSAYLAIKQKNQLPSDAAFYDTESLHTAIKYMFLIYGPYETLVRICERDWLIDVLENVVEDDLGNNQEESIEGVTHQLLSVFNVRNDNILSLPWPRQTSIESKVDGLKSSLLVPIQAFAHLETIEQDFTYELDQQRFNLAWAKRITDDAWAILEELLRFSLAYFGLHFENYLPKGVLCRPLSECSFKDLSNSLRNVEKFFKSGALPSESEQVGDGYQKVMVMRRRHFLQHLPVSDVYEEREEILKKVDFNRQEERRAISENLQNVCWRSFGRLLPFGVLGKSKYDEVACDSFHDIYETLVMVKKILRNLVHNVVIPRLIQVIGQGTDTYGNQIIWFTDKLEIQHRIEPRELEWMYITSGQIYEISQYYVMLAPDSDNAMREPLIDPIIYSIDEIENFICAR